MKVGDLVIHKDGVTWCDYTFVIVDKLQFVKYNGGTDKCIKVAVLSEPDDPRRRDKDFSVGTTLPWEEEKFWEVINESR